MKKENSLCAVKAYLMGGRLRLFIKIYSKAGFINFFVYTTQECTKTTTFKKSFSKNLMIPDTDL